MRCDLSKTKGRFLIEWEEFSWSNMANSLPNTAAEEGFTFHSFLDVYKVSMSSLNGASLESKHQSGKFEADKITAFSIVLKEFRRR